MTEPVAESTLEGQAPAPQPAERKPWHAPTLTQVDLQLTAQSSGAFSDGPAQSLG